jgi:hypothetical protein
MKKILIALLISIPSIAFSQTTQKKNTAYLQLWGNGLLLSVNYERQLTATPGLNAQIGIGLGNYKPVIPIGLNYLFNINNQKSFIEIGAAAVLTERDNLYNDFIFETTEPTRKEYTTAFVPSMGYRYQSSKGFICKIMYSPVLSGIQNFWGSGGVGIGWRF